MLDLQVRHREPLRQLLAADVGNASIQTISTEERVKLLIIRDLTRLGWQTDFNGNRVTIAPPAAYDKQTIRASMEIRRQELLQKHSVWIKDHIGLAVKNLAPGKKAWASPVEPTIEVCSSQEQRDIFRIFRYYWSSPYSEYVGRRIKLLIRDAAIPESPIIGIAALGSSIVHIPDRDKWIGWDKKTRTKNLVYTMDAYVLGALPPYNELLGGKLISYMVASNEVRAIFRDKYAGAITNIAKRTANRLACIFTTSLYGRSSQYNRLTFNDQLLYIPIGKTKGFGTLHLTDETFLAMRDLLDENGFAVSNKFGDGPIWRMRVIRTAANVLGFDSDFLLRHSFQRQIYAVPLARNYREFLTGENTRLRYYDHPLEALASHWRKRWLNMRKTNIRIQQKVCDFEPGAFSVV
jgi:hypothetical protein